MKTAKLIAIAGCAIILLLSVSGCGAPAPTATPVPPTETPSATKKPTATKTATATITRTPTVGPGGFPRKFHVEGNAFVDQFGQKMIFRGMAQPDPINLALEHYYLQPDWNSHYYQVMASWGANIIRLGILPRSLRNHSWSSIFDILDQTIAWAGENGMYVVIDFHSCGSIADNWYNNGDPQYTTNLQEWLTFWDKISSRYANNDIVAFYEIFNEPANQMQPPAKAKWKAWKVVVEQVIPVIRGNDPDKIILVGGLNWAYDLSYVADEPIEFENIGYSTHPYLIRLIADRKNWDTAFGKVSEKYAVFATEFGYQDDMPGFENKMVGNKRYGQAIIDYLEAHRISWMVWVFDNTWTTRLLIEKDFTPSSSGEYFRSRMLYEREGSPKPRPGNFTKAAPKNGSDDALTNPILIWLDSINADSYEYCIDTSNNNSCDDSWISAGAKIRTYLSGLRAGTKYYWQVRAVNADGLTYADGGGWGSFTVSNITNLSLQRPVKASSYENSTAWPENAVDGDYLTRWGSKFSDPQWIQVDLGAVFDIRRIVLYWEAAFATSYEIQVSSNGTSWTTIYSTTKGNGGTDELSVSGSGRYVRLYGTERRDFGGGVRWGYSLYEFEVYGS
jgi:endoglucanase